MAVYLPLEDAWMAGEMPRQKQFKWAWGFYEMRYVYFPEELAGYCPIWVNADYLEKGRMEGGVFKVGDARFKAVYVDVDYMDSRALRRLVELAEGGLPVILKRRVREPGACLHQYYEALVEKLARLPSVSQDLPPQLEPLIRGQKIPPHWCRQDDETLYVFFAQPKAKGLKFPLDYGQSYTSEAVEMPVTVHFRGEAYELRLRFDPYQSLLFKLEKGKVEPIDIWFMPKVPVVKPRPPDYKAPWLVFN